MTRFLIENDQVISLQALRPLKKGDFQVLALSAKTAEALKQLAARYEKFMIAHSALSLNEICFTANTGRAHFAHRLSVIATSTHEARDTFSVSVIGLSVVKRKCRTRTSIKPF